MPGHAGGGDGEGAVALVEGDQAATEAQREVRDGEDRRASAVLLEGHVAGQRLAGDREDHAGRGDPDERTRLEVEGHRGVADRDQLVHLVGGLVHGQGERALELHVAGQEGRRVHGAGDARRQATLVHGGGGQIVGQQDEDALDAIEDGGGADLDLGAADREHRPGLAGAARSALDAEAALDGERADGQDQADSLDPQVRAARDANGVEAATRLLDLDVERLGAGVHGQPDVAAEADRADRQARADLELARDPGRPGDQVAVHADVTHAGQHEAGAGQAELGGGRPSAVALLGDGQRRDGQGLAAQGQADGAALERDPGRDGLRVHRVRGVRRVGVQRERQGAGEADARQVEVDLAADRAGYPAAREDQVRGAGTQRDHRGGAGAERHRHAGEVEVRRGDVGDRLLGDRDVAGDPDAAEVEGDAGAGEPEEAASGQVHRHGLPVAHVDLGARGRGAGVQREGQVATDDHAGHEEPRVAAELGGQTGRADQEGTGAASDHDTGGARAEGQVDARGGDADLRGRRRTGLGVGRRRDGDLLEDEGAAERLAGDHQRLRRRDRQDHAHRVRGDAGRGVRGAGGVQPQLAGEGLVALAGQVQVHRGVDAGHDAAVGDGQAAGGQRDLDRAVAGGDRTHAELERASGLAARQVGDAGADAHRELRRVGGRGGGVAEGEAAVEGERAVHAEDQVAGDDAAPAPVAPLVPFTWTVPVKVRPGTPIRLTVPSASSRLRVPIVAFTPVISRPLAFGFGEPSSSRRGPWPTNRVPSVIVMTPPPEVKPPTSSMKSPILIEPLPAICTNGLPAVGLP